MSLRIHYLQHVPFEGLGSIARWIDARGHCASATNLYAGDSFPSTDDFDWLVVMGGPMATADEAEYPWLVLEKTFILSAIDRGKTVLGICLGSQLVAEVLGGTVRPGAVAGTETEIGWWPITKTDAGRNHPLLAAMPDTFTVFHWHGDAWTPPPGATLLAGSIGCPSQAFIVRERVLGLQFHFEATPEGVAELLHEGAGDLDISGRYIQSADAIRAGLHHADANNSVLHAILDQLACSHSSSGLSHPGLGGISA